MKKAKLLLTGGLFVSCSMLHAQIRSIDMEAVLVSPAEGSTYTSEENIPFTIDVKNNGPDDLVAGDTLFFTEGTAGIPVILAQPIANGQTMTIFSQGISLTLPGNEPATTDFCIYVFDDPSTQLTLGGQPIVVSYKDPDTLNNVACNEITLIPQTNSISEINEGNKPLSIFPNPASSEVLLHFEMEKEGPLAVIVKDISGRSVIFKNYDPVKLSADNPIRLNIAQLSTGTYFVEMNAGNKRSIGKLVIRK